MDEVVWIASGSILVSGPEQWKVIQQQTKRRLRILRQELLNHFGIISDLLHHLSFLIIDCVFFYICHINRLGVKSDKYQLDVTVWMEMHLKRHVDKTHKNIRPYVCDFCGKSFKSKNHIKIHERIHSKETPYNCHMCGESFKMKLTLRTHLKGVHNVHEEQKVFCDICKRGFVSEVALKAHLNSRIHETEKCLYCSEMFTSDYMINHLRDEHGTSKAS
ncbi:hypothetical protein HUJ04_009105 [Dendroctonus ponderosae]|nr:hypothetical protein HUJ04_009105 [Dendroctonus ponderosae]